MLLTKIESIELRDGSKVNTLGTATFIGTSMHIATDTTVELFDIQQGERTGDLFIGVKVAGLVYRYLASHFVSGTVGVQHA